MSGLAIGSGLARGLANVLLSKRQADREQASKADDRSQALKIALFTKGIEDGLNPDELMSAIGLDLNFGEKPKGKGAPDPNAILSQVLAPAMMGRAAGGSTPSSPASAVPSTSDTTVGGADLASQPGGADPYAAPLAPLASRAAVTPGNPPAQSAESRRTLFGLALPTEAEKTARAVETAKAVEGAKLSAQTEAKLDQAQRLRTIDPSMSVEDSLIAVGLKIPQDSFGVLPQGGGVLNKKTGEITEPPSAKTTNLPATLRERVEELRSLHPDWDDAQLRAAAATAIDSDREEDRRAKAVAAADLAANRDIRNALLRLQQNAGGLTPSQLLAEKDRLREAWQKKIQPMMERQEAVNKIDAALTALDGGNRLAAVDQILVAFQKLNDERTGVREGEVNRLMAGLGLPAKIDGAILRLQKNGAAIPDKELRGLAQLAKDSAQAMDRARTESLRGYRQSIEQSVKPFGIDPTDIFGDSSVGHTFTATLNGKPYSFPTQAALDVFKRQFPAAQ